MRQCRGVQERRDEVAVAGGVDAVGDDAREAEPRGERVDVDRVAGAGDRAGAERQLVDSRRARDAKRAMIAAQRRGVRQEEVRDQHRLRAAQVRVRRHQRVARGLGLVGEHRDERRDRALHLRDRGASGRAADRPRPARCAIVRCAGVARRRRPAPPARARRTSARPRRRSRRADVEERRIRSGPRRDLLERRADRSTRRRATARRRARALRPTPGCPSRRPRTAGDRTGTTRRTRTARRRDRPRTVRTRDVPCSAHRFRASGSLARRGLDRQPPDLDEPFGGAVIVQVARP